MEERCTGGLGAWADGEFRLNGIGKLSALAMSMSLSATAAAAPAGVERVDPLLIHAGAVIAIPGEKPLGPTTIIVVGGRIASIEPGYIDRANGQVIDLREDRKSVV